MCYYILSRYSSTYCAFQTQPIKCDSWHTADLIYTAAVETSLSLHPNTIMVSAGSIVYYVTHPAELRAIIQWTTWHNAVHERDESNESPELKECFRFLKMTSRSFAAVIQELHPELLVPVTLFYLVLRGLDTIEDDMTIDIAEKEPLLREFHTHLEDESWTFDRNGPNEKDRELLVKFDQVEKEFKKVKAPYRVIIADICKRMGNGMADYAKNQDASANGIKTVKEYEQYCHYVAGLVGEGLTRLFVEAKLANPALLQRPELMESMGQFLQQTNIIRDIREDHDDKRYFWPREIWSKHVDHFPDLFLPENKEKALSCQSEMILLALKRADDCLFYMAGVKEQSVFNFVAIPQTMAIATLELCFQNPAMFARNIKITKGHACQLMTESTQNLQLVCDIFRRYARKIHRKNNPRDPHFLDISIACGKIERFIESIFPTQTPRTLARNEKEAQATAQAVAAQAGPPSASGVKPLTEAEVEERKRDAEESNREMWFMMLAVFLTLMVVTGCMVCSYTLPSRTLPTTAVLTPIFRRTMLTLIFSPRTAFRRLALRRPLRPCLQGASGGKFPPSPACGTRGAC